MAHSPKTLICPTCDQPFDAQNQDASKPFCSERCKLIDLGDWLDESYAIPGQPSPTAPPSEEEF